MAEWNDTDGESYSDAYIPIDDSDEKQGDYKTKKICKVCGVVLGEDESYCSKHGDELCFIYSCQGCGYSFYDIQGYSVINYCPNCKEPLAEKQKDFIKIHKGKDHYKPMKKCSNPNCGEI